MHHFDGIACSSSFYHLDKLFDDSELDCEEQQFIDLVSDKDKEPESKNWKIVLSNDVTL